MKHIFSGTALLFLVGCATPIPQNVAVLAIDSVPPGATIAADGKDLGVTPSKITYTLPQGKNFPQTTSPITLTWVSGARLNTPLRVDGGGTTYHYRLQRPADAHQIFKQIYNTALI